MLKQEIIEKITKYFKLTHFEAEKIYDDIFQSIMQGVRNDNITDVGNLGEFIIKYDENNNGGHKKTVEFLPSSNLEDELNQSSAEYTPPAQVVTTTPESIVKTPPEIHKEPQYKETKQIIDEVPPPEVIAHNLQIEEEKETESHLSVEEELKRKREEIIKKLTPQHQEEYHHLLHVEKGLPLNVPKPIVIKDPVYKEKFEAKEEEPESKSDEVKEAKDGVKPLQEEKKEEAKDEVKPVQEEIKEEVKEEVKAVQEEIKEEVKEEVKAVQEEIKEETKEEIKEEVKEAEKESAEELTNKSFSDYFTEIKTGKKSEGISKQSAETVIPPIAVDLHKEIVGEQTPPPPPPVQEKKPEPVEPAPPFVKQNGNGYPAGTDFQKKDDSYYIWYKDSEPNAIDTQTMSYEYELLYQATKEAEYKSKLRIYVTTFILFFSIVLLLLIFSPVIYKYFFNPEEEQTIEEYVPEEQSSTTPENNETTVTPPVQNTAPAQETKVPPPASNEQQTAADQNKEQQKEQKTEQPPAAEQKDPPTSPGIQGVVKTGLGWMDEKNKVVYVQLENGKFTIQESAWESDEKANKRINVVGAYNIEGMKGSVFKADLGSKGIWYRVRFGEFTTIEEAKKKAEELRNKEKMKLQAFLFSILMIT